jgi:O-antigen/teichoic acid export membrane protein
MTETNAVVGAAPVARRMTRGFAALSVGRVATLAMQLVAFALVAANLGPVGVGAYTFALAFYGLFAYVTNFGVRTIAMRDITQAPATEREIVVNLFYLRLLLGGATYGVLLVTLWAGGYSSVERQASLVTGILLVVLALESFQVILEVRLRMGWVSVAAVVQGVVLVGGTWLACRNDADVVDLLWVFVASNAVNFLIVATVALREVDGLVWWPRPRIWARLAKAAVVLGLAQLCITLYYRLDLLILAAIKPDDDVGQYGAAYRVLETFIVVPSLAMTVLTPVIAASVVAGTVVLQRRYGHLMHLIALLSFPIAVAGVLTAARVFPMVPGFGEFGGAGVALAILAPAAPCIFFGTALSAVLVSGHEQRRLLGVSFAGLLVNIALNVALIPAFSYRGAAIATTVTEVVVVVGLAAAIRRHLAVQWPWRSVARAARAAGVMAVVLVVTLPLPAFLQLGAGLVAYAVALLPTGALRWSDLGGLMGADGPSVTIEAGEASTPVRTWRRLLGAGACTMVEADRRLPTWLPVAARLAGAEPVVLRVDAVLPGSGRLRNVVWPWFVARVELAPAIDASEVAERWPRLAPLVAVDGDGVVVTNHG